MKFPPFVLKEVSDSRGVPTVSAEAELNGELVVAKVPSGTSAGTHEAVALSADRVIAQQAELNSWLTGSDFTALVELDRALVEKDGTARKEKLGANTILALSMLYCRLMAKSLGRELWQYLSEEYGKIKGSVPGVNRPRTALVEPMMVLIEGGVHAQSGPWMQETLVNGSAADGEKAWQVLNTKSYPLGMEGGFDIPFSDRDKANSEVLETISQAISQTKTPLTISVDFAASQIPEGHRLSVAQIVELAKTWRLASIEDPFPEDDWSSFSQLVLELAGHRLATVVVGDDLTVTSVDRLQEALDKKALGGVIIKPNQVGSVSETLAFIRLAQEEQLKTIVSHRSGETDDTFIADLAVAIGADSLKAGAPAKPERKVKYDRLAAIQDQPIQDQP